jgi:transcriptional regulator with XRE-family HTH domain
MTKKPSERSPEVGQRIRNLREQRGWSYSELAQNSGVSRSYLYQIETGESSPTGEKLKNIANALGVSTSDLLGESTERLEIPESLKSFADKEKLSREDMEMLSKLKYRGKQPTSEDQWRILYSVIKATLGNGGKPN